MRGLRLLPWLQEAYRTDPDAVRWMFDCESCMRTQSEINRQYLGCGYAPQPDAAIPVMPWNHRGRDVQSDEHKDGKLHLPVCAGFVCGLPEVIEISDAHMAWSKGQLAEFVDGKPTPALRHGIKILETENSKVQSWQMRESERKAKG